MGRRRGRAAAEARAHRRSGPAVPVHESEIGRVGELQWVMGMLFVHWIGDGKWHGWLPTVSRGSGGASAGCGGRNREKGAKWACANARASVWGAPGCARGPEEGVVAWEQELASRREAWRLERRRRDVERREQASARPGSGGADAGAARGAGKGGAGAAGARHMAGEAAGRRAQRNRGGGDSR
jgi:hypothetical protein